MPMMNLRDVESWALKEFEDDFRSLPHHDTLTFEPNDTTRPRSGSTNLKLLLGNIRSTGQDPNEEEETGEGRKEGPCVWASLFTGAQDVRVVFRVDGSNQIHVDFRDATLKKPFSRVFWPDMPNPDQGKMDLMELVRFYMLSAGQIESVEVENPCRRETGFKARFRNACASIRNHERRLAMKTSSISDPSPQKRKLSQDSQSIRDEETQSNNKRRKLPTSNAPRMKDCASSPTIRNSELDDTTDVMSILEDGVQQDSSDMQRATTVRHTKPTNVSLQERVKEVRKRATDGRRKVQRRENEELQELFDDLSIQLARSQEEVDEENKRAETWKAKVEEEQRKVAAEQEKAKEEMQKATSLQAQLEEERKENEGLQARLAEEQNRSVKAEARAVKAEEDLAAEVKRTVKAEDRAMKAEAEIKNTRESFRIMASSMGLRVEEAG